MFYMYIYYCNNKKPNTYLLYIVICCDRYAMVLENVLNKINRNE